MLNNIGNYLTILDYHIIYMCALYLLINIIPILPCYIFKFEKSNINNCTLNILYLANH